MADGNREAITTKVTQIAERVGAGAGIEIVDVQMLKAAAVLDFCASTLTALQGSTPHHHGSSIDRGFGLG